MPKPLELSAEIMTPPPVPQAAQVASAQPPSVAPRPKAKVEEIKVPFQVRWPKSDVKAAKLAALNLDFSSESEFMLACFHAYMQSSGNRK
jgi:hypothetical protein